MDSPLFDLAEYLKALEPPQFRYQGFTYRGRFLSVDEWSRYADAFHQLRVASSAEGAGTVAENEARWRELVRQFCDHIFPHPRWLVWRPSVADALLAQPFAVQAAAIRSFSTPLARAVGAAPPAPGETPKPSSQPTTPRTSGPTPPIPS